MRVDQRAPAPTTAAVVQQQQPPTPVGLPAVREQPPENGAPQRAGAHELERESERGSGAPLQSARAVGRSLNRQPDPVEIEVIHEQSRAPRPEPLKRCYEIWTQNTVYAVDAKMICVEVRAPSTGEVKEDHPFLGARLVGGQVQDDDSIEMSYPLPRPGSFAVFESVKNNRRSFSRTSSVERVVLRMRIVTMIDAAQGPDWNGFTS